MNAAAALKETFVAMFRKEFQLSSRIEPLRTIAIESRDQPFFNVASVSGQAHTFNSRRAY
jgi:hypothetical protein